MEFLHGGKAWLLQPSAEMVTTLHADATFAWRWVVVLRSPPACAVMEKKDSTTFLQIFVGYLVQ
jgi:hypothetical protein